MIKNKHPYKDMKCWAGMSQLVYEEFHDIERNGMIIISHDEMVTVFINLIADFNKMKRLQSESRLDSPMEI